MSFTNQVNLSFGFTLSIVKILKSEKQFTTTIRSRNQRNGKEKER